MHAEHQALPLPGSGQRTSGNMEAAVDELTELAAAHPVSAVIRLELARALRAARRDAEALNTLEQAIEVAPELAEAWRELSLLRAARGDARGCDAAYAHFETLSPQEARHPEAAAALAAERLEAGKAMLEHALAHSPHDVVALRLLAGTAAARADYVEAERLLEECLRLAPGYSRARLDLVRVLHQREKAEQMLPLLERLLLSGPGSLHCRVLQAVAYDRLGHTQRAAGILEKLASEFPRSDLVWLNYGHNLRSAARPKDAIYAYRTCIALKPACSEAWMALANLGTYRFTGQDVEVMQAQLQRDDLRNGDRAQLEFSLGKALEEASDVSRSSSSGCRAAARHSSSRFCRAPNDESGRAGLSVTPTPVHPALQSWRGTGRA
jgi:tetratricopeptide (TPR) repeat protein